MTDGLRYVALGDSMSVDDYLLSSFGEDDVADEVVGRALTGLTEVIRRLRARCLVLPDNRAERVGRGRDPSDMVGHHRRKAVS